MEGELIHITHWLRPASWLYGVAVWLRNLLFDVGILKSEEFAIPTICVGNITAGGTGKTPHTEYLLRLLLPRHSVAVVSRGYKRKSKGLVVADAHTSMAEMGDEPWQMLHKYPEAQVVVDADRRRALHYLQDEAPQRPDVVLLDDAFQHRYVQASLNIVLTDYHRLVSDDCLLPAGRLREPLSALYRAQIIVVTKCPRNLKPMDFRVLKKALNLRPFQRIFYSTYRYGSIYRLFDSDSATQETSQSVLDAETHVLLLTGIATPRQMMMDLAATTRHITPLSFADHHDFSDTDVEDIESAFTALQGNKRIVLTTEKDAARLRQVSHFSPILKRHLYVLPIEVEFLRDEGAAFDTLIGSSLI